MTAFERTLGPSAGARDDAAALGAMMTGVLYGEWLRTRLYIAASIALGLGAAYGFGVLNRVVGLRSFDADLIVNVTLFFAEFLLYAVLLYSFEGRDRMVAGMPSMTLRHPVPTWALVAVRFGFGVSAVLVVTGTLCAIWTSVGLMTEPVAPSLARYVFLYAVLQTLAYNIRRVGDWSVPLLLGAVAVLYTAHVWLTGRFPLFATVAPASSVAFATGAVAAGFAVSVVSVQRQRTRTHPNRRAARATRKTALVRKVFRSPQSAQFWLECRRIAAMVVRCVAGSAVVWFALIALFQPMSLGEDSYRFMLFFDGLRFMVLPAAASGVALAGLIAALQSRRRATGNDRIFDYGRPISTVALVRTRLQASCAVVGALGMAAALPSIVLGWIAIDAYVELPNSIYDDPNTLLVRLVLLTLVGVPAFFWAAYWGGLSLALLALGIAPLGMVEYFYGEAAAKTFFEMGTPGAAIGLVGGALFLVGRRLLPFSHVLLAAAFAAIGAHAMPALAELELFSVPNTLRSIPLEVSAAFFCVLFAPVVWTPYWLERNRHK